MHYVCMCPHPGPNCNFIKMGDFSKSERFTLTWIRGLCVRVQAQERRNWICPHITFLLIALSQSLCITFTLNKEQIMRLRNGFSYVRLNMSHNEAAVCSPSRLYMQLLHSFNTFKALGHDAFPFLLSSADKKKYLKLFAPWTPFCPGLLGGR